MKTDGTDTKQEQQEKAEAPAKRDTVGAWLEQNKDQIAKALPKHVTPERMARIMLTMMRNNEKLQRANPYTLLGAIMQAAQLGLEPNTPLGHCYIIPYNVSVKLPNNTWGKELQAQFQMGYQGLIELAGRAGLIVKAFAVDEADEFSYSQGLDEHLRHVPAATPSGRVVAYWAKYTLPDGRQSFSVWSRECVLQHAKQYSQSWDDKAGKFQDKSAWATSFDSMAKKTVIIDVLKYAPKQVELAMAMARDERVVSFDALNAELDTAMDGEYEEVE